MGHATIGKSDGIVRTIFTPHYRLSVLDPKLHGVQEGLRITKKALGEMRSVAANQLDAADVLRSRGGRPSLVNRLESDHQRKKR